MHTSQITTQLDETAYGSGGQKRALAQQLPTEEEKSKVVIVNYSELTAEEKATFDNFVAMIESKTHEG